MAPIYEEITLAWQGKEYTVQPDYRMVQRIEARGISIIGVIQRMWRGEPPMSQVAEIMAHMLRSGGAETATSENVYGHLMSHIVEDSEEIQRIGSAISTAFFPRERSSGNSEAPGDGGRPKGKKKAKKKPK